MFKTVDEIKGRDKNKKNDVIGCIKLKFLYFGAKHGRTNRLFNVQISGATG